MSAQTKRIYLCPLVGDCEAEADAYKSFVLSLGAADAQKQVAAAENGSFSIGLGPAIGFSCTVDYDSTAKTLTSINCRSGPSAAPTQYYP